LCAENGADGNTYTLDPTTGAGARTLVSNTAFGLRNALDFDSSDVAYTLDTEGDLLTLDVYTAASSLIGSTGVPLMSGLAFTPAPVPGPVLGAGLPGLIMAAGAFLAWRRQKTNQLAA
jgi:hypothetical protein